MNRPLHVLIVEDTQDVRFLLEVAFNRPGYRTRACSNGQEAVDACLKDGGRFDVILMDLQMPVMDGLTATKLLREAPETAHTPIICLSAHSQVMLNGDAHLFNRLIDKPFTPAQLFSAVDEVVAQTAARPS